MAAAERDYVFGPFRLRQRARLLLHDGVPVPLTSRAFDLLAILLESAGRVVPREDLLSRVWPSGRVHDNNLAVQVSALRRALGRTQAGHPYIVTVPGRGFQFVAPVVVEAGHEVRATGRGENGQGNLPLPANRLIGRAELVAEVVTGLQAARLVTLVGPSGIGKTRIAEAVALDLASAFPDGAWLIDLAALGDPALIPATIARTLGLSVGAEDGVRDSVMRQLKPRSALLVLDNCEHLRSAVAALAGDLIEACPGLRLLATSLERLDLPAERVCQVGNLALPPAGAAMPAEELLGYAACELFVERAGSLDRRFVLGDADVPILAEICQRLDGIPLAIELAASRQPILGLAQVRRGLDDRFRLLVGGERVALSRHLTLLAAHDWAWSLLAEPVQRSLARLSVFAGGFDLAAAVAILADDRPGAADEIVDHIVGLAERSLLSIDPGEPARRYRLLESTRAYAAKHLAGEGAAAAIRQAHATYFAERFEAAEHAWETEPTEAWFAALARDLDNLRAALAWSFAEGGDAALGRRLCAASLHLWFAAKSVPEYRHWLDRALAAPPDPTGPLAARLWFARARAVLALQTRKDAAERAIELARVAGETGTLGRALALEGEVLRRSGDLDGAAAVLTEAASLLATVQAIKSCADASQQLAIIRFHQGDLAGSRALNADALARYRATGHDAGIAACLIRAANDHFAAGRIAEAVEATTEALALSRTLHNDYFVELTLGNLAAYETARSNWPAAWRAGIEALPAAIQIDDREGLASIVQTLAEILAWNGMVEASASLLGYSEALFEAEGEARDPDSRAGHAKLVTALEAALDPAALATCRAIGAHWTAEIALAAIRQLKPFEERRAAQG